MLKIRELVSFVRLLLSVITDITCYTNDAGKTHNHGNFEMWTCWGKMAGASWHIKPSTIIIIKSSFIVDTFCHRSIDVYMKHTVRIMNILSDYNYKVS